MKERCNPGNRFRDKMMRSQYDCCDDVTRAEDSGYQPPKGGPRLFAEERFAQSAHRKEST